MITQNTLHYRIMPSLDIEHDHDHSTTLAAYPDCEICGLPARNVYPATNGKDYDLCDTHLYDLLRYMRSWYDIRLRTKLAAINAELQQEKGGQVA